MCLYRHIQTFWYFSGLQYLFSLYMLCTFNSKLYGICLNYLINGNNKVWQRTRRHLAQLKIFCPTHSWIESK